MIKLLEIAYYEADLKCKQSRKIPRNSTCLLLQSMPYLDCELYDLCLWSDPAGITDTLLDEPGGAPKAIFLRAIASYLKLQVLEFLLQGALRPAYSQNTREDARTEESLYPCRRSLSWL